MKKVYLIVLILILALVTGCRTKQYSPEKAVKNGEVVWDYSGFFNVEKLDKFIENVNNKIPDKIKIAQFGEEGLFLVQNISYDGKVIKAVFDSTMEFHEHQRKKEKKEYTEIIKVKYFWEEKNTNFFYYYLKNQDEKREIFIAPEEHK
jgi:hypothetical protein